MHAPPPRPRSHAVARAPLRRAVLALLLACAAVGLSGGPAPTADGGKGGEVTWTVRTAANNYGDDRSSFSYAVNPGGRVKDAMVVANHGEKPLELAVYAADGFTTDTGRLDLLTPDRDSHGIGAWVHAGRDSVVVKPGRSAQIPFTATVPEHATPGDYVGGVLTSLKQPDDAEGINVDRRLGIRVTLRVGGKLRPGLTIENPHLDYSGHLNPFAKGDATLTYTIRNTGNVVLTGRQKAYAEGPFGRLRKEAGRLAAPPDLLPGESWRTKVRLHDVTPALRLTATASLTPLLTDASGSTTALKPVEATTSTWAVPWTVLLLLIAAVAALVLTLRHRAHRERREETRVREAVEEALREQEKRKSARS
ncbi:DUF916 domain-containing protein [Streptomyces sp. NPDC049954]|uniref:WxL protein peptidoglycan domain-containing protein n=1 Tax=Streptomyces sp. NPDC049954 TaxID=3155779 RepID=UPI003448ED4D